MDEPIIVVQAFDVIRTEVEAIIKEKIRLAEIEVKNKRPSSPSKVPYGRRR
tara:strand:- start:1106 stop:1258 length:153 start_codon:yes stop_codon:yes gene_type:complete